MGEADERSACLSCGYDLGGLAGVAVCPECGAKVHGPEARIRELGEAAKDAVWLGVAALVSCVLCCGPLSLLIAVPAVYRSGKVLTRASVEEIPEFMVSQARMGRTCAVIACALSVVFGVLWYLRFI